jgi:hypothetical protein
VATTVAEELVRAGLPTIIPLRAREGMLDCLRKGSLGHFPRQGYQLYYAMGLAVLLADDGPSPELDEVKRSIAQTPSEVESWPRQQALLLQWLEERAAAVGHPA